MIYYGQNQEDSVIVEYFDGIGLKGKLLDIGAYDGRTFSNSRALLKYGWEGILIEADFGNAENCRKNTIDLNAKTLCAAVHPFDSTIATFYSSNGDMVGSTETAHVKKWSKNVQFKECLVSQVSVTQLYNTFSDTFHFINVDVEGISAEIAKVIIPMFQNCKLICIEHDNQQDYLRNLCRQYGYQHELMLNAENIIMAK